MRLWVLAAERPDSLDDGGFGVEMPTTPAATRHVGVPCKCDNRACGLSFADGHSGITRSTHGLGACSDPDQNTRRPFPENLLRAVR